MTSNKAGLSPIRFYENYYFDLGLEKILSETGEDRHRSAIMPSHFGAPHALHLADANA